MDRCHSRASCASRAGFAKRLDRGRMGGAEAISAATLVCGSAAQVADAADCRGDPLPAAQGLAVANAAALLSADFDVAPLVLAEQGSA